MKKLLVLGLAFVFFLAFLLVGSLGGIANASAILIDWSTTKVEDGKLSSTLPESVAIGLGGLGNLLLAVAGTLLLWMFRALQTIAEWIQSMIDSKSQPLQAVSTNDLSADEATWAKCESLLEDAIYRGDRNLTVILCERMNGTPYLTQKAEKPEAKVQNA
jgi:hypothetical protein